MDNALQLLLSGGDKQQSELRMYLHFQDQDDFSIRLLGVLSKEKLQVALHELRRQIYESQREAVHTELVQNPYALSSVSDALYRVQEDLTKQIIHSRREQLRDLDRLELRWRRLQATSAFLQPPPWLRAAVRAQRRRAEGSVPGTPAVGPGTPSVAPGTPAVGPGMPDRASGSPGRAGGSPANGGTPARTPERSPVLAPVFGTSRSALFSDEGLAHSPLSPAAVDPAAASSDERVNHVLSKYYMWAEHMEPLFTRLRRLVGGTVGETSEDLPLSEGRIPPNRLLVFCAGVDATQPMMLRERFQLMEHWGQISDRHLASYLCPCVEAERAVWGRALSARRASRGLPEAPGPSAPETPATPERGAPAPGARHGCGKEVIECTARHLWSLLSRERDLIAAVGDLARAHERERAVTERERLRMEEMRASVEAQRVAQEAESRKTLELAEVLEAENVEVRRALASKEAQLAALAAELVASQRERDMLAQEAAYWRAARDDLERLLSRPGEARARPGQQAAGPDEEKEVLRGLLGETQRELQRATAELRAGHRDREELLRHLARVLQAASGAHGAASTASNAASCAGSPLSSACPSPAPARTPAELLLAAPAPPEPGTGLALDDPACGTDSTVSASSDDDLEFARRRIASPLHPGSKLDTVRRFGDLAKM